LKRSISLADFTAEQISSFCGVLNRNLKAIEKHFDFTLRLNDDELAIVSKQEIPQTALATIEHILEQSRQVALSLHEVENLLSISDKHALVDLERFAIKLRSMYITPKSELQCRYLERIAKKVVNFSIGPAGTGKTFLAVAMGCRRLKTRKSVD